MAIIPSVANATPIVGFKPGRIIEDNVFTNANSMTVEQIQLFLNSKVSSCDTYGTQTSEFGGGTRAQWAASRGYSTPFTCLKNYTENGKSSAQIIFDVAHQYQINPQVFIVLLQKEQGLVTDSWPLTTQYRTATGYGCPDTAACDSVYYGFTNQLNWSGKMFRSILNNSPTWYSPYTLGNNFIQWSPTASCGGSIVNIENRSTQALYNYTPYQPNQSALNAGYGSGDSCGAYGNRNFFLYFRDWFNYNGGPAAFKSTSSSTIYVPINGYKLVATSAAVLQDYGISLDSIQTVSQEYVDSIPNPPAESNISSGIGHIIKSNQDDDEDGASVYLISRGQRYKVQNMSQVYSLGFTDSDISFLPLSYIYAMNSAGELSNYVVSPYGSVFEISDQKKHIIFEYSTYISHNPSDHVTLLSYYLTNKITSGTPLTDRIVMIKKSNSDQVDLYKSDSYYGIPDYDTFSCWGLNSVPVYRLPQNDYIADYTTTYNLDCVVNNGTTNQLLSNGNRSTIPSEINITGQVVPSNLNSLLSAIPLRQEPLKQYVKTQNSAAVWYINNGDKRVIPSYNAFVLLGLNSSNIDNIPTSVLDRFTTKGMLLAKGELVKDPDSSAVYAISDNERIAYDSSNLFISYGNKWGDIETFSKTLLDQSYPYKNNNVPNYFVNKSTNQLYFIGQNTCFQVSNNSISALSINIDSISTSQVFNERLFNNFNYNCRPSSTFIKQSGQNLVYWIDNGIKHPIYTYSSMLNLNSGTEPSVTEVPIEFINNVSSGTPYY